MKELILSTYDIEGGAAKDAFRLHKAMLKLGVDSKMLVQYKSSDEYSIISPGTRIERIKAKSRTILDNLPLNFYKGYKNLPWHISWVSSGIIKKIYKLNPDIINLNWICNGLINIREISKLPCKVIWTIHDMWSFTGGCHYSGDCTRYLKKCGKCPQLGSNKELDLSRWVWNQKTRYWMNLNLTVVSPSNWLANIAKKSTIFKNKRIEVIPYAIDTNIFKPISKLEARKILNLPINKKIVIFGSLDATSDKRKGFYLLKPALNKIANSSANEDLELAIFGSSKPNNPVDLGLKTHFFGILKDDISLATIYSAADVFLAPSIEDNLPNTILESLTCGTPVVAFNIGGNPDMIKHKTNGYLVKPFEVEDFVEGIKWVLENKENICNLSNNARRFALEKFSDIKIAEKYLKLYQEIIKL